MTTHSQEAVHSFGRDLVVNVLANLIAGAIIYLGAVVGGYISPNGLLTTIALVGVAATLVFFALGRAYVKSGGDEPRASQLKTAVNVTRVIMLAACLAIATFYLIR
ncbi:hypothetical protein ACFWFK_30885 [Micromonospora chalcea]